MIRPLKLSEYFGKNFDEYVTLKKNVSVMKTGKSAKKSSTIARAIVLRIITDQHFNAIVLRKQLLDHEKSTFPAIVKAFNKFQRLTGYDWRNDWLVSKGAKNPNITNIKTGQVIRFVSFDRPESLAGLELEEEQFYYGTLWFEEPMQIVDRNVSGISSAEKQKREEESFEIITSSGFRGDLPHPGAHREIVFSFNDWSDGDYWIINKYVSTFLQEDAEILEMKGKMLVYDPYYKNGLGILVMVGTGGINEFNDEQYIKFIQEIKRNNPEFYKAIWLGTSAMVTGNAYSKVNIAKINREIDTTKVQEWLIGIDYSSSKDYIVVLLIGYNDDDKSVQVVDGWRYHRGKVKPPNIPMPEPKLIKFIWNKIMHWRELYNFNESDKMVEIHVDPRDATVRAYLQDHWAKAPGSARIDIMQPSPAAKFKSASSWIRVMATRYMMGSGKISIAKKLEWLLDEFKIRTVRKDGSIVDGKDDGPQAFEYSWAHQMERMLPREAYFAIQEAYRGVAYELREQNKGN